MSVSFGESAARLFGVSALLFGWKPDQFWNATPAELACLMDALQPPGQAPPTRAQLHEMMENDADG